MQMQASCDATGLRKSKNRRGDRKGRGGKERKRAAMDGERREGGRGRERDRREKGGLFGRDERRGGRSEHGCVGEEVV